MSSNLHRMQIDVPHCEYGKCEYNLPEIIREWLFSLGLTYQYCSTGSWGSGYYDDGRSNAESHYLIGNIQREDSMAFQLRFPECKVHLLNQQMV